MFVIAGVTGHVGGVAAKILLEKKQKVKVVVRDEKKGARWAKQGAEIAIGDLANEKFLAETFKNAQGVFVLLPANWASTNVLEDQKKVGATISKAIKDSKVPHVVVLSSVGAELPDGTGPIKGLHHLELALKSTGAKVTAVRAGFFMENIGMNIGAAKSAGIYPNMFPSHDIPLPMIATQDIGKFVAEALMSGAKNEIVDVHGPSYTVKQLADKISKALKKPLQIMDIPPSLWLESLTKAGVPKPWAQEYVEMYTSMLAGKVKPHGDRMITGKTEIDEVIKVLIP